VDTPAFWEVYTQFVTRFAKIVAGVPSEAFDASGEEPSRKLGERYVAIYREKTGLTFPTEPWDILCACINAVFNSWNSERAVAYRRQHDIRGLAGTAVTVQSMFPSQVSGVVFTHDPTNPSANRMIIEASYGLGESIVSGDVTPDRYVVQREDLKSFETVIGNKASLVAALGDNGPRRGAHEASLTPEQVEELSKVSLHVEKHFGKPMDIEWGWADGRFALLQCRPIRGLDIVLDVEKGRLEEIERLKTLAGNKRHVWVTHNLGETLRAPTPLTWDIVARFMSGNGGFGLVYRDFGFRPSKEVADCGFLQLICGRIYADPERLARLFWEDAPMTYEIDEVLKDRTCLDRAPTKFEADKIDGKFLLRVPRLIGVMRRSARIMREGVKTAKERFDNEVLPPYLEYIRGKRIQDLTKLSTAGVIAELDDRCRLVLDDFGKESLKPGLFAGQAFGNVETLLVQLMGRADGEQLLRVLTMGLEGDTTVEQDVVLWQVARGQGSVEEFIERFGHRAAGEMELSEPRWREDREYIEQVVKSVGSGKGRSPAEIHHENVKKREDAEKSLPEILDKWGGGSLLDDLLADLRLAQQLLPYRESGKYYLMMGYELIRLAIMDLSRRWDLGRGVFFLRREELPRFETEREKWVEVIAERKVRWQSLQRLDPAVIVDSDHLERLGLRQEYKDGTELEGEALAPGIASGPAAIVFNPHQAGEIGTDYILVCPSTDPAWTVLFINARGLVVERGGLLSHGAIVARDFGIPAVTCPDATNRIKNGEMIRVDGNIGRITLLGGRKEQGVAPAETAVTGGPPGSSPEHGEDRHA
jgi:pyruvate,water dikinase